MLGYIREIIRAAVLFICFALLTFALLNLPTILAYLRYQLSSHSSGDFARADSLYTHTDGFRIVIPALDVDAPVILSNKTRYTQMGPELEQGVVHYAGTALPGERGNVALTAHSSAYPWNPGRYNQVFTLLDKLKEGDRVTLYYHRRAYRYIITGSRVVSANASEVLAPTEERMITLITCWPRFTSWQRLVVTGREIAD